MALPEAIQRPLEIHDLRLRRLYDYWRDKCGARRFPARRDIDPLEFRYLLGEIMMVDVLQEPLRFRVRLHGANLAARAGYDMTGKMLDELPGPEYRVYVLERCRGLVENGEPLATKHDRLLDSRLWRYEALWLPFSEDGAAVSTLLCAIIYDDKPLSRDQTLSSA
jgi:hypothetical protein